MLNGRRGAVTAPPAPAKDFKALVAVVDYHSGGRQSNGSRAWNSGQTPGQHRALTPGATSANRKRDEDIGILTVIRVAGGARAAKEIALASIMRFASNAFALQCAVQLRLMCTDRGWIQADRSH